MESNLAIEPGHRLLGSYYGGGISDIPLDFVAPSASYGNEEYQVHRSVAGLAKRAESLVSAPTFASTKQPYAEARSFGNDVVSSAASSSSSSTNSGAFVNAVPVHANKLAIDELLAPAGAVTKDRSGNGDDGSVYLQVPHLPDVPFFLEPNSHVYITGRSSPAVDKLMSSVMDTVIRILEEVFAQCQIDFVFRPAKCKWKAQRCQQYTKVLFRARLFRCTNGDFVAEFQKKRGDYFLMRDAFERFLSAMESEGLVQSVADPSRVHTPVLSGPPADFGFTAPPVTPPSSSASSSFCGGTKLCSPFAVGDGIFIPPPAMFAFRSTTTSSPVNQQQLGDMAVVADEQAEKQPQSYSRAMGTGQQQQMPVKDSLLPLVRMAEAPCQVLNYEAANAIASLAASEDNRAVLKEAGAIPALVGLIKRTACKDVKQAVVTALSNLSESACCKCPIVEAGACPNLLQLLSHEMEGHTNIYRELEMRRECARTLANLSEEYATQMVSEIGKEIVLAWINAVDLVRDERLRMHGQRFRKRVRCCC